MLVFCPPGCATASTSPIQGSDKYGVKSPLCLSGIHADAIGLNGGQMMLEIVKCPKKSEAKSAKGLTSLAFVPTDDDKCYK